MIVGVLKEPAFESRVSLLAEGAAVLIKKGVEVWVESTAGEKAFTNDDDYTKIGATIKSAQEIASSADIILSINNPQIPVSEKSTILLGIYQPLFNASLMRDWAKQNLTVFSLDMLPRTTRAQIVEVFDTRPAVKEEVMSLGAKFIEVEGAADASKAGGYAVEQTEDFLQKQKAKIAESIAKADIVITTAQIPGKKAPILVTTEMIQPMKKGSLIIDLAAATGGNTELTKNNETVNYSGVSIIGDSALASQMPFDASKMYGKNVLNFLQLIIDKERKLNLNFEDDLIKGACITHNGEVTNDRVKSL
jgi:NAD/NADP transhydrogenase alpha subunit